MALAIKNGRSSVRIQARPAKINEQPDGNGSMQQDRRNRIKILSRRFEEGEDYHAEKEYGEVSEQDGKRMAHEQVEKTSAGGRLPVLFAGHDGERADVSAA